MKKWVWLAVVVAALFTGYAVAYATKPAVPSVKGYLDGRDILFQHTEVSDPKVSELLRLGFGAALSFFSGVQVLAAMAAIPAFRMEAPAVAPGAGRPGVDAGAAISGVSEGERTEQR